MVTLHARGWTIRRLSRELGISRERVHRILRDNNKKRETGNAVPRETVVKPSKLDPFKEYIAELLDTYTDPPITSQRVLEKIREKGYDGGRTILGEYVASVRENKPVNRSFMWRHHPASGDHTTGAITPSILRTPELRRRLLSSVSF